jgi:5-methylcytosine-specific restriction protein B
VAVAEASTREHIDAVVGEWRERCLIADGSLLFSGEGLWTTENLKTAYRNIADNPLLNARSFMEKLKDQLGSERKLTLLGAELLIFYYLFAWVGSIGGERKRSRVNEVLGWADKALPEDSEVWRALGEQGIGHPGQYFLLRPDVQLGFILDFAIRLKEKPEAERREILSDPWQLRNFSDEAEEHGAAGMRHIVLHLLQPDYFERIASGEHKQSIATTYGGLIDGEVEDVDERLLKIRKQLEGLLNKPSEEIDFYWEPLAGTWGGWKGGEDANAVDGLELKKQLVLFGPPGTSKTYEAKQLAAQVIRRSALRSWGPVEYFSKQARVDELVAEHVRRLQLHPAYSYEEFIRGQRLRGGNVSFEDGYLLRFIEEIEAEIVPEGEPKLPWVLILDELNRTDLSRVFGEAFSVLEDRNQKVDLPGTEPGERLRSISLPERLYVIGTMNLIDQSLDQIDFALRRRFLWRRVGFERARLVEVLRERWAETGMEDRYNWDRIQDEIELFTARAEQLNEQIAASSLLGRDYEIGHTYFFDIVGLLAKSERLHRETRASQFLWNRRGEGHRPARDLWRMSLEPLLDQYLQGVDAESRASELDRLGQIFLMGKTS